MAFGQIDVSRPGRMPTRSMPTLTSMTTRHETPMRPTDSASGSTLRVVVAGDDRIGRDGRAKRPFELRLADDHVGDQQVTDADGRHHLGF